MAENINQVFTANPASSMESTDLMYLGRSPYATADDFAITFANLQASITAVGTLTAGVWNGTEIGIAYGGTGVTSVTSTPTASAWAGWDANSNLSANNILLGFASTVSAAGTTVLDVASARYQVLTGSTTQTYTMPVVSTLALGQTWVLDNESSGNLTAQSSGGNSIQVVAPGGRVGLTCIAITGTGAASWSASYVIDNGGVSSITGTANQVVASASTGDITLSLPQAIATISSPTFSSLVLSAALTVGSGSDLFTLNSSTSIDGIIDDDTMATASATNVPTAESTKAYVDGLIGGAVPAPGAAGVILRSDGADWQNSSFTLAASYATNDLIYCSSTNNLTALTTVNNASFSTNASGVPTWLALTDGQVVVGSSAGAPLAATLTAGTGVIITNAANSITVASTGGGMGWSNIGGSTQAAAVDNGYISDDAGATTITLPATAAIGSKVGVEGLGAGGWILAASAGDTIQIGSGETSSGGTLTSSAATDSVYVLCIVANTTWRVITTNSAGLIIA